jgi:hypothetical protein
MVQGFGLLLFGKPGLCMPPVCRKMLPQISARYDCFLFSLNIYHSSHISHSSSIWVSLWGYHTFFVFIRSLFHTSIKKTYNQNFSPLPINKPWPIFFEVLLLTPFLLEQRWPNSRSRSLLGLISVIIYHPVGSVALNLAAFLDQSTSTKKPSPSWK